MQKNFIFIAAVLVALTASCDLLEVTKGKAQGSLQIHFLEENEILTKAASPDTNNFILSVTDSKGASIYYGSFGAAPQKLLVSAGTYTVSAKSCNFTTPVFDSPQYGDTQVVVVSEGQGCSVNLECTQINAGVRLKIDSDFLTEYPDAVLFLKSADGKLMYSYSEKRIAYFNPGSVSLVMNRKSVDKTLCTRTLSAQEILTLKVNVASQDSDNIEAGIHVSVDTTRYWTNEEIVIGGEDADKGADITSALSVAQAKQKIGSTDVWVYGFIVGGDMSSSKCSFEGPFTSRTNIAIASKSSCTDKESCLSVQLSSGKIRDALNLVDNEDLLGKKVYIKGDIVASYYGIPGIQSISEYSF